MARAERKALFLRDMPVALVREAKAAAARRGATLTTIVAEALARSLQMNDGTQYTADDLDRDMTWYRQNRSRLLRQYSGEYVAIVDAAVVDHARDFGALAARVFARFGKRDVYMPRIPSHRADGALRTHRDRGRASGADLT